MQITFLPDRYPKIALKERYPAVHRCLEEKGILEGKHELVRFVGIANAGPDECVFFTPHGAPDDRDSEGVGFARTLMAAVTKFAREYSRSGEDNSEEPSLSYAALIASIAEDYRDHGIFSERLRTQSINSGKPDWRATLRRQLPLLANSGGPVFTDIRTVRPFTSSDNILAILQAEVVREIHERHGWWLEHSFGTRPVPSASNPPRWPREIWAVMLRRFRQNLFADRPLVLSALLEAYLDHNPSSDQGATVCGIPDFSTVWEAMLRRVLPGVEEGWNARLPAPYYMKDDGVIEAAGRMEMDIVVRTGDRLVIVDAKYYPATGVRSAPGWPDIVKQIYYAEAMATIPEGPGPDRIDNCFVFPARDSGAVGKLANVAMYDNHRKHLARFGPVRCHYAGMRDVADAYCHGRMIDPVF